MNEVDPIVSEELDITKRRLIGKATPNPALSYSHRDAQFV